jgi:predicted permease
MLRRKSLPVISLVRLVLVPLATLVILFLLPSSCPEELPLAILISSACPVGSNIAVYARLYGADDAYATETVIYSTLLCIVTIPLLAMLAGRVLL